MKLTFVGLGAMDLPMAVNLARAGHEMTVFSRSPRPLDAFADRPPRLAADLRAAVEGAEAVLTMVADDNALEAVVRGGLLDGLDAGAVHVAMSTVSVATARRMAALHAERDRAYVAAPVFGRPDAAAAAKLWIVLAGEAEQRARVRPLLEAMGRGISEFGDEPWRANLVKLGNNFVLAAMLETLGEAVALMRKAGIPPQDFIDAANRLFQSPVYANYGRMIAERRDGAELFKASLGLKDLRLLLAAADTLAVPMPLAGLAHDGLLTAIALGRGDADWSVLARVAQERAGLA
jgi:3-hydroxyisobutyrate dehydrogenase-like beta-hydroxyacid dehydrogenase